VEAVIKKSDSFRVGLSLQDDSPFVMRVGNKLKKLIEISGEDIELVVYNGMANANAQIAHVESFISSGFDVIILDPISYDDCALAVTIAQNAGIPLITTITETYNPTGYLSFVGSDHYESGVIEADMVADYLNGSGKVVILEGVMGISAQTGRYKGYMDVFKEYPSIEIVAVQTAAWQRNEAYAIVENWIRNEKDFSVVLAENDNMAMGAIEAIEELGKQDEIAVFGIDGDMDALLAVKEGRLAGTVFHNANKIAQTLYKCILLLKTYDAVEPVYLIPFEPVTQKNVDKYISEY
jgi:ABC-type sugar transport system substrate-binding protein